MAYQWVPVYGDSGARLNRQNEAKARVRRLQAGIYVFNLTVFDNLGQSDDDSVRVTVLGKQDRL